MKSLLLLVSSLFVLYVNGQIATFDFASLTGSEATAPANFNDPNVSISTFSRGSGLSAANNADRFNATNWALTSIANAVAGNKYMEFTITPNVGCSFTISSIYVQLQRSATGPSEIALRSSADGFTTDLDQTYSIVDNISTQNFTFTFSQMNISAATTYRFYMYAEGVLGSGGIGDGAGNDLVVNGSTSCSNTISTDAVSSNTFNVDCNGGSIGSTTFTSSGTFNSGNIFTAQLSDASGNFTTPISIGTLSGAPAEGVNPSGSVSILIPAGTTSGTAYRIRIISSSPNTTGSTNPSDITINFTPCTLSISSVNGAPFDVDCSNSDNGTVDFSSSGTFSSGNVFSVQLSNSSGNFSDPLIIGLIDGLPAEGYSPSGTINVSIPAAMSNGTGYRMRIVSSDPGITSSDNGSDLAISLTGSCEKPHITMAIINACNTTCDEGYNEVVFGTTGSYSLEATSQKFQLSYGTSLPGTVYTDVLLNNAATTLSIGIDAGCTMEFIDATGTTIPPHSTFILAYKDLCLDAFDWTGMCGFGPFYMIYQDDPDWTTAGVFKNGNTGGLRYFNSTFQVTTNEIFSIDYNYNSTLLQTTAAGGDGDYVAFGQNGGSASYGDNDCIMTPLLLPIELIEFRGKLNGDKEVELYWSTASERNAAYYEILHSLDGINFAKIGAVEAAGFSTEHVSYIFHHNKPNPGVNYYKLKSYDFDGTHTNNGIITVKGNQLYAYYDDQNHLLVFNKIGLYDIYSTEGKVISTRIDKKSIPFDYKGVFIIQDKLTGTMQKIIIY